MASSSGGDYHIPPDNGIFVDLKFNVYPIGNGRELNFAILVSPMQKQKKELNFTLTRPKVLLRRSSDNFKILYASQTKQGILEWDTSPSLQRYTRRCGFVVKPKEIKKSGSKIGFTITPKYPKNFRILKSEFKISTYQSNRADLYFKFIRAKDWARIFINVTPN